MILQENNYTFPLERKQNSDNSPLNLLGKYESKKKYLQI